MAPESPDERLLDRALAHVSREAREMLLDALYCRLHNTGYALQGNTEEGDMEWLALRIYHAAGEFREDSTAWEYLDMEERQRWARLGKIVLDLLPLLLRRVADRCVLQSQAIKQMLDAEKRQGSDQS